MEKTVELFEKVIVSTVLINAGEIVVTTQSRKRVFIKIPLEGQMFHEILSQAQRGDEFEIKAKCVGRSHLEVKEINYLNKLEPVPATA
ncbi:MAG TPA: hypothetical protein VJK25_00015 [Patescibacteria group bacterium]|nr:hypothetical protein [Patescibacteria group bacterium]